MSLSHVQQNYSRAIEVSPSNRLSYMKAGHCSLGYERVIDIARECKELRALDVEIMGSTKAMQVDWPRLNDLIGRSLPQMSFSTWAM